MRPVFFMPNLTSRPQRTAGQSQAANLLARRISERTHLGLEAYWNLRPHALETDYGWKQTAPVPGVMKNVSVAECAGRERTTGNSNP